MKRFTRFTMGFILGAFFGGTLAILFTPYSGEKLRTEFPVIIQRNIEEIRKAGAQKREELEKRLSELRAPQAE